jgi:hypothetical protein
MRRAHTLYSGFFFFLASWSRDDEQEAFATLHQSLFDELDPQGALETTTFHELLHAAWNLQRFSRIEAEISLGTSEDFTDPATNRGPRPPLPPSVPRPAGIL